MNKQEFKRFLSMLLCLLMVIGLFPGTSAYAAAGTLNVIGGQVTVDYSGKNAEATVVNDVVTAKAKATESSSCSGTSYAEDTTTLTIKNNSAAQATLVFDYVPVLNGGSMVLDGAAVTNSGTFSKSVSANETVTLTLKSGKSATAAEVTLRNFALVGDGEFSITVKAPVNGTATANGTAVTANMTINATYAAGFSLEAVPAEGYDFGGWVDENNNIIMKTAKGNIRPTRNMTISPWFIPKGAAMFGVGGKIFDDLNAAVKEAQSGAEKNIALLNSGTLAAGEYTIPKGITLVIPFDETHTCFKANPEVVNDYPQNQKVFRKLTLASGAKIAVDGEVSVSAKYSSGAGGRPMGVTGDYGQIQMESGSEIRLNPGAFLYTWGFITGSGSVYAASGSTVYELFQITDFRGGSATLTSNDTNKRHFPLAQYFVQNIEAPITYEPGAKEYGQAAMTARGRTVVASPLFVGEGGLFVNYGTITKWYDPAGDQLHVSINGDAVLSSISLTISGVTADSSKYVLPINNIMMHIESGTLSNPQAVEFLPDSGIQVGPGGTLNIGAAGEINLIDQKEWGKYVWAGSDSYLAPLVYSPTRGGNARTYGTMKSAVLDVNGTVNVDGILKTSASGANVTSSQGGGVINFNSADKASNIWHFNQGPNTWSEIPVVSAKLKNADGSFVETANHTGGEAYTYDAGSGKWKDPNAIAEYTITWKNADGTVLLEEQLAENTMPEYTGETPVKAEDENNTYKFTGWTPELAPVTADATYTAKFETVPKTATITWMKDDGTVLETDKDVAYGTMPEFNGETPVKASNDPSFNYAFDGWDPACTAVSGDATYTAKFKQVPNTFTVTWYDEDGKTVLETDKNVAYGTVPTYDGKTPAKASDADFDYTFSGWTPDVAEVTGDVSYTAVYSKTAKYCTITWVNEDGSVLETDEKVAIGATPEYNGETPAKQGNAQYSYKFAGWTPAVTPAEGNATYKATFTSEVNKYTVNWYNAEDVLDENGQKILLKTETLPYGTIPEFGLDNPEKIGDGHYSYEFNGWTPAVVPVTGNADYYASYKQVENAYTVTWLNWDGSVLEEDTGVVWGTVPEYNGAIPVKEGDAQYSYVFNGWEIQAKTRMAALDPEGNTLTEVTENVTYKASFKQVVNEYSITWLNEDGSQLAVTSVPYGTVPTYEGIPTKEGDAEFSYTFAGWTPEVVAVTGPASYTATFTEAVNSYTVTWNNYDGTQLAQQSCEYGQTPVYSGETPVKPGDAQFSYTFAGWNVAVAPVTGDVTYTAVFTETVNEYTITWQDYNGAVLDTVSVQYGQMPAFSGTQPYREPDAHYTYTFAGWTPEISAVTGEATYTAAYTTTTNKYTVTWMDADGTILETDEEVLYDTMPEYNGAEPTKAEDVQYSYSFAGWSPVVDKVEGNICYTAVYEKTLRSYTVTWYAEDGKTVLDTTKANYGETPVYVKETPAKAADAMNTYEFAGWTPEPSAITGDVSYKATFNAVPIMYTVTWKNDDGSVLLQKQYQATTIPAYDGVPAKQADAQYTYTFAGWTPDVKPVSADTEYTAKFNKTVNTYTVTWTDFNDSVLETDEKVPYGTMPEFNGKEPSREATPAFSYRFTGWAPELSAVTGNVTYKAQYEETGRTYTVKWLSEDGKIVLETDENVPYGTMPQFNGEQPVKEKDELFTYEFAGWEPELIKVEADAEYKVKFTPVPIMHNAVWKDYDGRELYRVEFQAGTEPEYVGETPVRAQDAAYIYTFTGWDKAVDAETGDVTFTANYESTLRQYSVRFQNADGSVIYAEKTVNYGETPSFDAAEPQQQAPDVFHEYKFIGWTPEFAPVGGEQTYTAQFELAGITGWISFTDDNGEHMGYAVNGNPYVNCWADVPTEIEGESGTVTENRSYYFDADGYIVKGIQTVPARDAESGREGRFIFDEITGVFQSEINGPYTTQRLDEQGTPVKGKTDIVWTENGEIVERDGLVKNTLTNEYYYFVGNKAVKADEPDEFTDYLVVNNNSLPLPSEMMYRFDRNGIIIHDVNTSLNGIQPASDDGRLYLFVDGVKIGWGLFEYPQGSGKFYYARTSTGAIIRSCDYWISQLNGYDQTAGIKEGNYHFNEDGTMVIPQPAPEKNGVVAENGSLYYYENGVLCPKGLVKIGEDYYYVRTSNCEVIHGRSYWVTLTNDLLPSGQYEFGDDGKMLNPPAKPTNPPVQKNGIVEEDGKLWYYENGRKTPAGLIKIGNDYYYVSTSNSQVIRNRSYWVTKTNGLLPSALYQFGPDGKMIQK